MALPREPQRPNLRLVGDVAARSASASPPLRPGATRSSKTSLRLTDAGGPIRMAAAISEQEAGLQVANEMRSAAGLSALDARWIFAVQVSRELTGGRAAIITPESRARLMTMGTGFGLRPFDASLVIAIVQDAARSGEDELGRAVTERLRMIRPGADLFGPRPMPWRRVFVHAAVITGAAVALAWILARWIAG